MGWDDVGSAGSFYRSIRKWGGMTYTVRARCIGEGRTMHAVCGRCIGERRVRRRTQCGVVV